MKIYSAWMMTGFALALGTFALGAQDSPRPAGPTPPPPLPPPLPTPGALPLPARNTAQTPPTLGPRSSILNPITTPLAPPATTPISPSSTVSVRPFTGQPGPVQVVPPQGFPAAGSFPPVQPIGVLTALSWDAAQKEYTSKPGEQVAPFTFWLTNTSSAEVSITSVRTSCGCTVAKLPSTPWIVAPGKGGPIEVTVNLAGKSGLITKAVTVESPSGMTNLIVKVNIGGGAPNIVSASNRMNDTERLKNMQQALADRQSLFKKQECAKCHADPVKDLAGGQQIYNAACHICHDSPIRASMVPDLRVLAHATDAEYWRNWVSYGRAGSMMPAFAHSEGGPLSETQVNALVNYLVQAYPSRGTRSASAGVGGQNSAAVIRASSAYSQPTIVSPAVAVPR
jgi:mono/diheme cytochrome c family protein